MEEQPPVPEPVVEEAPPDVLYELAASLGTAGSLAAVRELPDEEFAMLVAKACNAARTEVDHAWLDRLVILRRVALLRNARPAMALVLLATADVAVALGEGGIRVDALETLVGVRHLLKQRGKAHSAALLLARAQDETGDPHAAEVTLNKALTQARELGRGGNAAEGGARMAATLTQLGQLLARAGRRDEAEAWLLGAVDMATDPEGRQAAQAAYDRFTSG
jgi:hypothetical protein